MKIFTGLAIVTMLFLTSCTQTGNAIGSLFEPVIGTWSASPLGVETTLVFNADKTCTETIEILGVASSKNGTWDVNDTTITRVFANDTSDVLYYSFNSDCSELTISKTNDGVSAVFTKD